MTPGGEEEWREVPDYPVRASSRGRIQRISTGNILKPHLDRYGYEYVALGKPWGQGKVHLLVARAFHGDRPSGFETRHLDGDRSNNRPENLRYGTKSENSLDAIAHGTHTTASKTHCKRGHPLSGENVRIRLNGDQQRRICLTCQKIYKSEYSKREV